MSGLLALKTSKLLKVTYVSRHDAVTAIIYMFTTAMVHSTWPAKHWPCRQLAIYVERFVSPLPYCWTTGYRGLCHQLCIYWGAHQAPMVSSKPRVTQSVLVKLRGSQNKTKSCECGKEICRKRDWQEWEGSKRGWARIIRIIHMYKIVKEQKFVNLTLNFSHFIQIVIFLN